MITHELSTSIKKHEFLDAAILLEDLYQSQATEPRKFANELLKLQTPSLDQMTKGISTLLLAHSTVSVDTTADSIGFGMQTAIFLANIAYAPNEIDERDIILGLAGDVGIKKFSHEMGSQPEAATRLSELGEWSVYRYGDTFAALLSAWGDEMYGDTHLQHHFVVGAGLALHALDVSYKKTVLAKREQRIKRFHDQLNNMVADSIDWDAMDWNQKRQT